MGEEKRVPLWGEEELMRLAVAQEEKTVPAPPKVTQPPRKRPTAGERALNAREHAFIEAYLRTGKRGEAARLAGFSHPSQGSALLKRPRVQRAIQQAAGRQMDAAKLSRTYVLTKLGSIIEGENVFAVIKALDQLSKLQGFYAPIRHQRLSEGAGGSYAQLVETLKAHGETFTEEERLQIRGQILEDIREAHEALALLGGVSEGH